MAVVETTHRLCSNVPPRTCIFPRRAEPLRIGGLDLSPLTPRVIAPIFRNASESEAREFVRQGMEIAEICLDLAGAETPKEAEAFVRSFLAGIDCIPVVLTARANFEGGKWKGSEASRLAAMVSALQLADAVDIELAANQILPDVVKAAHEAEKIVIISRHNCSGMDSHDQMVSALQKARNMGADMFKIACQVENELDAECILHFVRAYRDEFPLIATAMGDNKIARRTRLDLARNGSVLAFASAHGCSASGQWTLAETVAALRG